MWRMVRRCPRTCADVAGLPLQEWNSAIQVPAHSRPGPRVTWAGPRGVRWAWEACSAHFVATGCQLPPRRQFSGNSGYYGLRGA